MSNLRSSYQSELNRYFSRSSQSVEPPTSGAFCQARRKILPEAFQELHRRVADMADDHPDIKRLRPFSRVLAIDGSTLRLNGVDRPCKDYFRGVGGSAASSDQVTLARASYCYDLLNKLCVDARILPHDVGEVTAAHLHADILRKGDLVLLDRAYGGFRLCSHILQAGADFCVRLKTNTATRLIGDFLQSGQTSRIVEWNPRTWHIGQCEDLGLEANPMTVRLVRIPLKTGEVEVLLTSLLDEKAHDAPKMGGLYRLRWMVEEGFKLGKSQLEIERWSGKSQCAVEQDFYGRLVLSTMSAVMALSAQQVIERKNKEDAPGWQVNQTLVLRLLRDRWATLMNQTRRSRKAALLEMAPLLLRDPCRVRPGRSVPRNFKLRRRDFAFAYKAAA